MTTRRSATTTGLVDAPSEFAKYAPTGTVAKLSGGRVVYVPLHVQPLRYSVGARLAAAQRAK